MKKALTAAAIILLVSTGAVTDDVFRIEVGRDYHKYSNSDMQRRVWELERAVWQLQQKIYQIEANKQPTADTWICTINAFGNTYTGTGASRPVAQSKAVDACKNARGGDGFFCKDPKCEQ
jgi:hypothetical protein